MSQITHFTIRKLHGYRDFDLTIKDNILILVGENGVGKTTVLRMLYYFLSGQWNSLSKFRFEELRLTINNKTHVLHHALLKHRVKDLNKKFLKHLPPTQRHRFIDLLEQTDSPLLTPELEMLCDRYDIPFHYIYRELESGDLFTGRHNEKLSQISRDVRKSFSSQLLYLPTYRRIEQELSLIYKGVDDEQLQHKRRYHHLQPKKQNVYVELVEFGMKDVVRSINTTLEHLKDFAREDLNLLTLGYLGDVVDHKYAEVSVEQIQKASNETIENVLNRIHENILSQKSKLHLSQTIQQVKNGESLSEHTKVICHYFIKLLDFQEELQNRESSISKFCEVCNEYMVDKRFIYDSSSFSFNIISESFNGDIYDVELKQLSSGEKQIVSLFSHLYLSGGRNYFVLIDEPELSLSVPWQRRFLTDIRDGGFCNGIVAVTHSPFIYDNDLRSYAHGLGEFFDK